MTSRNRTDQRLERGQRTRDRLIQEGLRLFALKGYDSVSTRELAEASGANAAAIHFHFGGKSGLYAAIIDHVSGYLAAIYEDAIRIAPCATESREDAAKAARLMITRLTRVLLIAKRSQWTSLLLQREFINPSEAFERIFATTMQPMLGALSRAIETATGNSSQGFDTKVTAFGIFVLASSFSRNRNLFLKWAGQEEYSEQDVLDISSIVSRLALNGLQTGK